MIFKDLIILARPWQWIKNLLVFFPVVFALRLGEPDAWIKAGVAFLAFCLASSAVYVVNDIADRHADALHPRKRNRPLAAGRVGVPAAVVWSLILLAGAVNLALECSVPVLILVGLYLALQTAYTFFLKHKMLADVIAIALGFVLRGAAGAVAIHAEVSVWLFVCLFTVCLFMGFCKRRSEVAVLTDPDQAKGHRKTLIGYSPELLTHLITLSAAVVVISFLLYASSARTVQHFGTDYLVYTLPLVIFAICRFAMVSMIGVYHDPTEIVLRDWPLQAAVAAWAVLALLIIYKGPVIQDWLRLHL